MKLYIKNMVCDRCKMVVKAELEKLGQIATKVELGEVELQQKPSQEELIAIETALKNVGFSLIGDRKSQLVEKIKTLIIELIQTPNNHPKVNLSNYLTQHLHHDYSFLSNLFSSIEGVTIEHYFIAQRIEKVKELLVYDELTLSEIANELNYSSVAHLSGQFKKVTGLPPTHFRNIRWQKRKPLDQV
ncbi:MAG TPA: helix-turn-helix domain-containing protein [Marinilabiliaceae bacterium]|nr:helix-turn-helix domain-containing protein [Marinilabiliaceae bacterium]